MNNAVGLVQAYLYVNGYFTVTESPVLEPLVFGTGSRNSVAAPVGRIRTPEPATNFRPPVLGLPAPRTCLHLPRPRRWGPPRTAPS